MKITLFRNIARVKALFVVSIIALGASLSDGPPISAEELLTMELRLVSSKVTQGDPLKVKILFHNNSKRTIALNEEVYTWREATLDFDINTPSGRSLPKLYLPPRRSVPQKDDFRTVKPGETREWEIEVTYWYQIKEDGTHTMTAIYSNENDGSAFGLNAWIGKVNSNVVSFEVKSNDTGSN